MNETSANRVGTVVAGRPATARTQLAGAYRGLWHAWTAIFILAVLFIAPALPRPPSWQWVLIRAAPGPHKHFYPSVMVPVSAAKRYRAITIGEALSRGLEPAPGAHLTVRLLPTYYYALASAKYLPTGARLSRYFIFWQSLPQAIRYKRCIHVSMHMPFQGGVHGRPRSAPPGYFAGAISALRPRPSSPGYWLTVCFSVCAWLGLVVLVTTLSCKYRSFDFGARVAAMLMVAFWYALAWAYPPASTPLAAVSFLWWPAVLLLLYGAALGRLRAYGLSRKRRSAIPRGPQVAEGRDPGALGR